MFQMTELLLVFQFLQSSDGWLCCDSRSGVVGPGTTSYSLHAGATVPDAHCLPFHLGFATEGAGILGVLANLNLLHHLPEEGPIAGPVFTHDSYLLGVFGHVATNQVWAQRGLSRISPGFGIDFKGKQSSVLGQPLMFHFSLAFPQKRA